MSKSTASSRATASATPRSAAASYDHSRLVAARVAPELLGVDARDEKLVLLVEDSASDALLVRHMLRPASGELTAHVVVHCTNLRDARETLSGVTPSCILLDLDLPDAEGFEGLTYLRARLPETPIIVLTGRDDDRVGVQALNGGAQDYLAKDRVDAYSLTRSIRYAAERMRIEQEFRHVALHDQLTGLPNRWLFLDRLRLAVTRSTKPWIALERGQRFEDDAVIAPDRRLTAVMLVDLDHFKVVNDSFGHASGDLVLQAVASRLLSVLRPTDTVARLGGDEFAVICEGVTESDEALAVSARILDVLARPVAVDGGTASVTCSIGVAFSSDASVPETLVRCADVAMYVAKERGRNTVVSFLPVMGTG
jgi:diguanylate cyclase (GGDEF)-like protein